MNTDNVAIQAESLTRRFGGLRAVDGVSFSICRGEIAGCLGPNGAGKSTTIKMLIGILKPTSGSAMVAGFDVTGDPIEVKRRIGYVPENGAVYENLTPFEYLHLIGELQDLPAASIDERLEQYLSRFEIYHRRYEPMSTFSKGMKQKVALTSAFIHNPEIFFLDEPLTGLDVHATLLVKEMLQELAAQGKTVFYSSHILDVVERLASRVLVIHKGKMILDDTVAAVLARSGDASLEEIFRGLTKSEAAT